MEDEERRRRRSWGWGLVMAGGPLGGVGDAVLGASYI